MRGSGEPADRHPPTPPPTGGELRVERLTDPRERAVAEVLARAFAADPIFVHVVPDTAERARFLARFMGALVRRSHTLAVALVTAPALVGASLWKGPDLRALTPAQLAQCGLDRLADWLDAAALARFDRIFDAVDRALAEDVPEPCWYLGVLAVDPDWQGQGLGSRLMSPILEQASAQGLPVTLETAQPRNLPLYRRHGFAVLRELGPDVTGGPVVWTMKRPAGTAPCRDRAAGEAP